MSIKNCRKIVITGGVAVGKSSIVDIVETELTKLGINWRGVPEYIDIAPGVDPEHKHDKGLEMLNKYLNKQITVYEFQSYILDYYRWFFNTVNVKQDDVLIFERCLDDGITCFTNLDNQKGLINITEFNNLYEQVKQIDIDYNIPTYFENNSYIFIPIKTIDPVKDGKLIANIISNRSEENIIIGLYNTDKTCYERMLKRNRQGEVESYTQEYISKINKHYNELYKILMSGNKIRFLSLGKLFD